MSFFVYIVATRRNGTLYTGMTDDLVKRTWQHRNGIVPGFTKKYGVKMLVWYDCMKVANRRSHASAKIKRWNRAWKLQLIEQINPTWRDLWGDISG